MKCKEAKKNLKEYYRIFGDEPCYMESDIMLGITYLSKVAFTARMPVVVCLGMGTSIGSHNGGGSLGKVMQNYGDLAGFIMVTAGGNEANSSHHYHSEPLQARDDVEVELRVGDREKGFTMELWCDAPQLCSVALISPSGEYSGRTYARQGERQRIDFLLNDTVVNIEYLLLSFESGDECIRMRFQDPEMGIWRLRVFNDTELETQFDIWLPIQDFVTEGTYFLRADPDITLCEPSNNTQIITTSFYDGRDRSVAAVSSRGYNRKGAVKPDIATPGVNIFGPLPRIGNVYPSDEQERLETARYGYRSDSSSAAAIAAGASILLAEWGLIKRNDINMDSVVVQKYLIRGANRVGRKFPNKEWGYGTLDLYGVFEALRPRNN